MRVAIGHDGSPSAARAIRLALSLSWPPGSEIRVVRVATAMGPAGRDAGAGHPDLAEAVRTLARPDVAVTSAIIGGRPGTVLRDLAASWRADLLVLGARGLGPIRSLVLGSVSAELVERAPCSVLIARGTGHARLLVGTDGSPTSTAMPRSLCGWDLFHGARAVVVGVAPRGSAAPAGAGEPDDRALALATRRLAARLSTCGIEASDEVRAGDPAAVLLEVARTIDADLIVVGPRGRSRVARLLLGSVARKVAQHARHSVLVVRPPRRTAETP